MKVVVTSDFHHSATLPTVPECDLLLVPGDLGGREWMDAMLRPWLEDAPATEIVGIAGNHDFYARDHPDYMNALPWTYLEDEQWEGLGVKVWGAPWSPTFFNWAYMKDDPDLATIWKQVPSDIDILMVHGPVYGYRDEVKNSGNRGDKHVGSQTLRNRLEYVEFPRLKLVASGHIHEAYGVEQENGRWYVNGSWVDERYQEGNAPIELDIDFK